MGIIETIATKGESPGTGAMMQQQFLRSGIEKKKAREEKTKKESEVAAEKLLKTEKERKSALERKMEGQLREELAGLDPENPEDIKKAKKILAKGKGTTPFEKKMLELYYPKKKKPREQELKEMREELELKGEFKTSPYEMTPEREAFMKRQAEIEAAAWERKKKRGLEDRALPASQAVDLGDTQNSISQLDTMMEAAGKIDLQFGPTDILRGFNPWDTTAKGMKQLGAATKQIIGKGLEGGVLRKEDESKYEKIIPKLGDTREVLAIKYKQLRDMLVGKYKGQIRGLEAAGFDVSRYGDIPTIPTEETTEGWQELEPGIKIRIK
jgi:hypothetical protein